MWRFFLGFLVGGLVSLFLYAIILAGKRGEIDCE